MKINRIDHVGIIVNDLSEAKAFFLDFGLEVQGEWELDGDQLDRVGFKIFHQFDFGREIQSGKIGLNDVKVACVGLGMPDGQTWIELINFYTPSDKKDTQQPFANTQGIQHIAFAVEDIEAIVAKLKKRGTEIFSEIQQYEESYKLCYVRGPEGIILELAEKIK